MTDNDAAHTLAERSGPFLRILPRICVDKRRELPGDALQKAGHIAARLRAASDWIESLPRYWIEPEFNELCRDVFKKLTDICTFSAKMRISQPSTGFTVRQCVDILDSRKESSMKKSITQFFCLPKNMEKINDFANLCEQLYRSLDPTGTGNARDPPPYLHDMARYDHCEHNRALFNILQDHCRCCCGQHRSIANTDLLWHPTRLFLEGDCHGPSFSIVVSTLDLSYWQELRLNILSNNSVAAANLEMLDHGHICSLLDEWRFAPFLFELRPGCGLYRLPYPQKQGLIRASGQGEPLASALKNYDFDLQDRIVLSYCIARAYWQFYDSELMRRKWSSESIWFMPTTNFEQKVVLPLQAFVSFPFGGPDDTAEDFIHDLSIPINHRCPRIFALGILLLEIGLGRPIPTVAFQNGQNPNAQANFNHAAATSLLETLRNTEWEGFSNKTFFIDAVEYCLDYDNFSQESNYVTGHNDHMSTRLKNLCDRVVRPLEWLAITGFKYNSTELRYLRKAATTALDPSPAPEAYVSPEVGTFHSDQISQSGWMQKLQGIGSQIDKRWSGAERRHPIRIAILDTGINCEMPYYQDEDSGEDSRGQIECFRDFVDPKSACQRDTFGHGSLMARLVAEVTPFGSAPFVKIIVARVAENTKDLSSSMEKIAEAIRWAGEERANIISMSFGFPKAHEGISHAIHELSSRESGTIFLASSGNTSDEAEAFPARHPDVISIYATNRHGTFLDSNSQCPTDGSYILGTFGNDIPSRITAEFESKFPGVCRPGSSVATAVAAGIAGLMLAFIASRPENFSSPTSDEVFQRASRSDGMKALLRVMGPNPHDGRHFINPLYFWGKHRTHDAIFHAIYSCLSGIDRFP